MPAPPIGIIHLTDSHHKVTCIQQSGLAYSHTSHTLSKITTTQLTPTAAGVRADTTGCANMTILSACECSGPGHQHTVTNCSA